MPRLKCVTGHSITVYEYLLAIHVRNQVFRGIYALGREGDAEAIVGRYLLNRMRVTLDGPAEVTEFS